MEMSVLVTIVACSHYLKKNKEHAVALQRMGFTYLSPMKYLINKKPITTLH